MHLTEQRKCAIYPAFGGSGRMSQNDVLHLQANFKDWSAKRGSGLNDVDPFLYYVLDQILKPFNLSDEEIRYGITDGGNDGGVDAIYLLAKRNTLIRDDVDLKASGTFKIRIIMVQVKSSLSDTGFKPTDIDKFQSFTEDFYRQQRRLIAINTTLISSR